MLREQNPLALHADENMRDRSGCTTHRSDRDAQHRDG
jgi:hypothetical protein